MTEYQEGFNAGSRYGATWFDCPYTGFDPITAYKRRKWFDGFDAALAAQVPQQGEA
ncbi:hypothetical protein [Achromobacter denitrificans]|uniref:hypothetical protein n=1 Tax=Achromobacter denitrificans TaxID=32002 RepID=UPI003CFDE055